ncbi:hypothetical protein TNIN_190671 [Trichonephila inaurata madagascariensis]|uniref:Uncharacterized protein n=1 Tax=Trichonephila inaurata madagascariensis TaxID=2747483 RepID=A0A8X6XSM8_9ARAC|nr:hypothetical protein TNIN_190671 [Trichonephila inaurata madagascariensis]
MGTSEIAKEQEKNKKRRERELLRFLLGHPKLRSSGLVSRRRPNDFLRATEGGMGRRRRKELGSFEGGGRIVGGRIVTLGKGSAKRELGEFL